MELEMSRNNSIDASVSNQPNSCCRSFNRYRIEENQKYKSKSTLRYDDFVAMANKIHQNKYDYSQVSFTRRKDKVNIVCPIHGVFTRAVGSHLRGSGCDLCNGVSFGLNRERFISVCKNGLGTLYVLLCYDSRELFYKIGITSKTIEKRYPTIKSMPYNFKVIYEITHDADAVYDLEKILHKSLANLKHEPNKCFEGRTECFKSITPILYLLDGIKIS